VVGSVGDVVDVDKGSAHRCYRMTLVES
jgi:hypothetical protein